MRLLYFSSRDCWPLTSGARIRDYHLARYLSGRMDVHYAGLRAAHDPDGELPEDCAFPRTLFRRRKAYSARNLLGGLTGPLPVTVLNYTSDRIRAELTSLLTKGAFDSVQIEGVHLVEYVAVIRHVHPRMPIVADWHNIESEIMRRYAEIAPSALRRGIARYTVPKIERAENRLLQMCDAHTVVSFRDKEKLLERFPGARISIVPNGVDIAFYRLGERARNPREILFVGSMDYHANVDAATWFVSKVWPLLKAAIPDLVFRIVGRHPVPAVRALAAPDVLVTGTVEDIRPYYARAAATVVPLRVGGGTRLKILESMAASIPVVSTRLGAEGIEVREGADILLADDPASLASALEAIVNDNAVAERLSRGGLALVSRLYDWSTPGRQLYSVHAGLAGP
jgi:glycosyltransferase involved in cell wall biosynthesis